MAALLVSTAAIGSSLADLSVDSYTTVSCPAADAALAAFLDGRAQSAANYAERVGIPGILPAGTDVRRLGAPVTLFASLTTRRKIALTAGTTTYVSALPATSASVVMLASVAKMVTGTIFMHKYRHLLDTEVLELCSNVSSGIPRDFQDVFLVGRNVTYRELIEHTAGLPECGAEAHAVPNWPLAPLPTPH